MRIRTISLLALALGSVSLAPSAQAQGSATTEIVPVVSVTPSAPADAAAPRAEGAGPRRESTVAGVQLRNAAVALPEPAQARRSSTRTSTAATLTIVGAAAFIGGLLIGDNAGNAIAVVGLGVGLVGLWQLLR